MHLFGKRRAGPYLSPIGVRVARCAQAHNFFAMRVMFLAAFIGVSISAAQSYLVFNVFTYRMARVTPPTTTPLVVQAFDAIKKIDPASLLPWLVVLVIAFWFMPWFLRRMFDARSTTLPLRFRNQNKRSARLYQWYLSLFTLVILVVPVALSRTLAPNTPALAVLGATLIPLSLHASVFGCILISTALISRRGSFLVCAKCGYPMGSWRAATPACPECGRLWKSPWNARIGARRINTTILAWGAGTVLFSFAMQALGAYLIIHTLQ